MVVLVVVSGAGKLHTHPRRARKCLRTTWSRTETLDCNTVVSGGGDGAGGGGGEGEGKLHILDAPANAYNLVKDRNTRLQYCSEWWWWWCWWCWW